MWRSPSGGAPAIGRGAPPAAPTMGPTNETTRKTFRLELWRAVPVGMLEYMIVPFAGLVALNYYDASDAQKAFLLAVSQAGLIASLAVVPLVRRLGWPITRAAAAFGLSGAASIAFAATFADSLACYMAGLSVAFFTFTLPLPLMTQIYQNNYPSQRRGKIFAATTMFRGVTAVAFASFAGWWLDLGEENFRTLLWVFAAAGAWAALLTLRIPTAPVAAGSTNPFTAFRWLRSDKKFRVLIVSWMLMGLGNLTALKLWTEYFANAKYGNGFSALQVTLLTFVIPSTVKLLFTYPWGWLFDRLNFYMLRIILNFLFSAAVLVVFYGDGFWVMAIGTGLQGFAFAGGNIAWSLWVTKVAPAEHVAEYMSVHSFMTGLRGAAAPAVGFALLHQFGNGVALFSAGMMLLASLVILPEVRLGRARRRGSVIAPRDPSG